MWESLLNEMIANGINILEIEVKQETSLFTKEYKEKKIREVILTKLVPFTNNMSEFGINKETILNIINPIMDKYNLDENERAMVLSMVRNN